MTSQPHARMTELLAQFPLVYGKKLNFWPDQVDEHLLATYQPCSSGEKCVIEFLLMVWDHDRDWSQEGFGNFNMARAVAIWGGHPSANIDAVMGWLKAPFHP